MVSLFVLHSSAKYESKIADFNLPHPYFVAYRNIDVFDIRKLEFLGYHVDHCLRDMIMPF